MVLSDRAIRHAHRRGAHPARPLRPGAGAARVDRRSLRPALPRLPQQPLRLHRREAADAGPDRARRGAESDEPFILHPGEFVLGATLERVTLGDDIVARLEGKSSLGRLGLQVHSTAGFIDPGFDGHVTLELSNVANLPITLYPGMKIGQVSFLALDRAGGAAVRQRRARLEVPGPGRADAERVLAQLRRRVGGPTRPLQVRAAIAGRPGPVVACRLPRKGGGPTEY